MPETVAEAIRVVEAGLPRYFITANVDFVAQAHENTRLQDILVHAHRVVCDGMPLVWLSRLFPPVIPTRVAGSDLVFELFRAGNERQWRFFFLGSDEPTLTKTCQVLARDYPGLTVADTFSPPIAAVENWPNEEIARRVRQARPDILLVAVGCPKQEYWISQYASALGIPLAIGIGASLDFIAGRQTRAPRWMQKVGMEWFWRMLTDPGRLAARYWKDFRYLLRLSWLQWRFTRGGQQRDLNFQPLAEDNTAAVQLLAWSGSVELANLAHHPLPASPTRPILLDLTDVTFIDSAGIGRLLQAARVCQQAGQPFGLLRPGAQVRQVISSLHLQNQFPTVEDAADFPPVSARE